MICLHGFLDTGAAFDPLAGALADRWRVVVPSHRGHGESGHVGAGGYYHFPDYLLDVDGLYRALDIDKAIVVGHSMGASVACYFAGTFPDRVEGLVLLDGIGPPTVAQHELAPKRMRRWIDDVRRREGVTAPGAASLEDVARRIGRLSTGATPQRLLELAREAAWEDDEGRWHWRFDPLHRTQAPVAFDHLRFRFFLAAITCPVLALWAEKTPMHSPDEAAREAALGDVTVETIPGTGHNLHHERPDEVAQAMRRFLLAHGL